MSHVPSKNVLRERVQGVLNLYADPARRCCEGNATDLTVRWRVGSTVAVVTEECLQCHRARVDTLRMMAPPETEAEGG